ncbi:virulence-associated E family protein [Bradyrhizobium sp. AUGA SZCCT0283]|uniref:virulence-associated E family protein n=1 Tax=Bradyrhizobium sp. AUGA SZCCT0283 TaxID=2807671 RepID=UPI001BA9E844|nr:virulence-associated E family protein [Bradyrhizobium sp. AUGA SZCCT0283]MBR1276111.1 hypothetical protein [Bradyrhizobium sp. AUGA SZCCT0283]
MKDDVTRVLPVRAIWRDRRKNGTPLPTFYNAVAAITAFDIHCSYDTFHNSMLVGFNGDAVRHEIVPIIGEASDHAIIRLRKILSEQFGFDFTEQCVREAVISLALENCFDPVCDMLDEAEAGWDSVQRLDAMAVEYFNCKDTSLNRAFIRKMMIAAVRRARHPGCKFDNIVVFESAEGWNKSSALRLLAGDDNFSDESILGKHSREVQEQLASVWIHENAELAGMKKADVDSVKAYASRQVDSARPAYGHILKKQPRHSIDVGTTNRFEYLQSMDGNRRFWPVKITKCIDLDKLRRDRLQLWGEAARLESQGESIFLGSLWDDAVEAQEHRRVKDTWEPILANLSPEETVYAVNDRTPGGFEKKVVVVHVIDDQWRVATKDLLDTVLGLRPAQQETRHAMRLSAVMKNIGWERTSNGKVTIDGEQVYGYYRQIGKKVDNKGS